MCPSIPKVLERTNVGDDIKSAIVTSCLPTDKEFITTFLVGAELFAKAKFQCTSWVEAAVAQPSTSPEFADVWHI
eukprot:CAMPEP_0172756812 /NCGR_PEP_ID=MMETSP1074-20121228/162492_1 /TAXON_ID=2916 /ORGANISM="Ceratium fusus, Strain PA161109" /LENGTH=74 /DNA_ID=CAMNT_0013590121 /DNA_START=490 /DNA_END=714 /DNA_ORIENTATION=-